MGKNSYLSEPRHIGAGIEVPKTGVKPKDVSEIVRSESFEEEIQMYGVNDKEDAYYFFRPNLDEPWAIDKEHCVQITIQEVFSRLEKLENMEISSEKITWGRIEETLCDAADAYLGNNLYHYSNLFYRMNNALRDREGAKIAWKKEGNQFCLTIEWGEVMQKTFYAESLYKCFEDADKFLGP